MSKYIYWVKKDLFGCFRIEEIRDKDNETGLKRGRRYKNRNYSAPFAMLAPSLFVFYLPIQLICCYEWIWVFVGFVIHVQTRVQILSLGDDC